MAVPPFVGADAPIGVYQLVYSLVFFAAALFIALRPEKLTDRLGKILCPILVALIVVTFVGCLVNPLEGYGPATGDYATHAVVKGFIEGYQTMDTIAALAFGIVIAVNIRARGWRRRAPWCRVPSGRGWSPEGCCWRSTACWPTSAPCLAAHSQPGRRGGGPHQCGGPAVRHRGQRPAGGYLPHCLLQCVRGPYQLLRRVLPQHLPPAELPGWAVLFALVSMAISNAGLTQILEVSAPVLSAIYPVAIVLIALSFFQRWLEGRRWVYPAAVLCTGVFSVLFALKGLKVPLDFLDALPLADVGLGWVLPAGVGVVLGLLLSGRKR